MLLIAHRGNTNDYPENTVDAFQSAFDLGADGIEMDVQVNEQGKAIVVHDYLYQKSNKYPKFEDVIKTFGPKGTLEIEIKAFRPKEVKVITDIMSYHQPPNFEITSSIHPILPHVRKYLPNALIGAIFPDKFIEEWMTEAFIIRYLDGFMQLTQADIVHVPPSFYNKKVIRSLKEKYLLHHHIKTSNKVEYEKLQNLKVDRVTFDDIDLLRSIRGIDF